MATSLYNQLLNNAEITYPNKKISAYIKVIKMTTSEPVARNVKFVLFLAVSKLILKAINNFNHLTRTVPKHKLLHTQEDIAYECWMTFDTCIRNVKMKDVGKFGFYLNTALNRAIHRIFEYHYEKHFSVVDNSSDNEHLLTNAGYKQHIDFSEIDLMGLSELELDILKFKVRGGKLNVFLKEHNIANADYTKTFESIKEKLLHIYRDELYLQRLNEEA